VSALSLFLATALAGAVAALRGHARRERGLDLFALSAALFLVAHALVDIDWHAPANPILLFALLGFLGRPALREDACAAR
jgi:hypothetical protein